MPWARGDAVPHYDQGMQERLRPTEAVVAVLRRSNRVLVIKRGPKAILPGYWAPPSGRIESGETHEEALVREMKEELGLKATPIAKVWQCPTDDHHFVLHWWTAATDVRPLQVEPDEVSDVRWVTSDEFLALEPTFADDREFFRSVLPTLDNTGRGHPPGRTEAGL